MKIIYESKDEPLVAYVKNRESWDMKTQHYHNSMELFLLTEGDRLMVINNEPFVMTAGDLAVIKPYESHYAKIHTSKRMTRYIISVSEDMFEGVLSSKEIKRLFDVPKSYIMKLDDEWIKKLVSYWECAKDYYWSKDTLKIKISKFYIIQIMMCLSELSSENKKIVEASNILDREMLAFTRYIHENYKNPDFDMQTILNHTHMSKSKFCKKFKETFKTTFLSYLNLLRIMELRKRLKETDKSLEILAEECGFVSMQTMVRNFTQEFGMTPAKYRRSIKNLN